MMPVPTVDEIHTTGRICSKRSSGHAASSAMAAICNPVRERCEPMPASSPLNNWLNSARVATEYMQTVHCRMGTSQSAGMVMPIQLKSVPADRLAMRMLSSSQTANELKCLLRLMMAMATMANASNPNPASIIAPALVWATLARISESASQASAVSLAGPRKRAVQTTAACAFAAGISIAKPPRLLLSKPSWVSRLAPPQSGTRIEIPALHFHRVPRRKVDRPG
jgi:hypothetical protein